MKKILLFVFSLTLLINVQSQKRDSTTMQVYFNSSWRDQSRSIDTYGKNCEISSTLLQFGDPESNRPLQDELNLVYSYYKSGLVKEELVINIDGAGNQAIVARSLYTYRSNNREKEELQQRWNKTTLQWENESKRVEISNRDGQLIYIAYFNFEAGQWIPQSRDFISYIKKDVVVSALSQFYDNNRWLNIYKYETEFSKGYSRSVKTFYGWDDVNQKWVEEEKIATEYLPNTFLPTKEIYLDPINGVFTETFRATLEYNKRRLFTKQVLEVYDFSSGQWVRTNLDLKTYFKDGDVASAQYFDWDATLNDWVPTLRFLYTNNGCYKYDCRTKFYNRNRKGRRNGRVIGDNSVDKVKFNAELSSQNVQVYDIPASKNNNLRKYQRTMQVEIIKTPVQRVAEPSTLNEQTTFSILPNPASSYFTVNIKAVEGSEKSTVRLTDISGKTILLKNLQNAGQHKIDFNSNVKPGIYIVTISNNKSTVSQKLVVQ
jgi:uncharacterized protein YutD